MNRRDGTLEDVLLGLLDQGSNVGRVRICGRKEQYLSLLLRVARSGGRLCGRVREDDAEAKDADQREPELTDSGVTPSLISPYRRTRNFRLDQDREATNTCQNKDRDLLLFLFSAPQDGGPQKSLPDFHPDQSRR